MMGNRPGSLDDGSSDEKWGQDLEEGNAARCSCIEFFGIIRFVGQTLRKIFPSQRKKIDESFSVSEFELICAQLGPHRPDVYVLIKPLVMASDPLPIWICLTLFYSDQKVRPRGLSLFRKGYCYIP